MNDYQYINENGSPRDYFEIVNENGELCKEIERLNNIIKEAREYIESYINQFNGVYPTVDMRYLDLHKLLGILKGSDK